MKAQGFIQVVPERNALGRAKSLTIKRVTSRYPRDPLAGAIVMRVAVEIPEELANVQTVEAAASAGMLTLVLEPEPEPA